MIAVAVAVAQEINYLLQVTYLKSDLPKPLSRGKNYFLSPCELPQPPLLHDYVKWPKYS